MRRQPAREVPRGGRALRGRGAGPGPAWPARAHQGKLTSGALPARRCEEDRGSPRCCAAWSSCCPSAADRTPFLRGPMSATVRSARSSPTRTSPFSAVVVIKTLIDRYAGTLSVFRVVSGTVKHDDTILDTTSGTEARERLGKLHVLHGGGEHEEAERGRPRRHRGRGQAEGHVHTGHALSAREGRCHPAAGDPDPARRVISYAISGPVEGRRGQGALLTRPAW